MKKQMLCFLVFCLVFVFDTSAQVTLGTISGTVKDETGAVLPGAAVVIRNRDTGMVRTVPTDARGHYAAPNLGLGSYEVEGSSAGFETTVRRGIQLTVGGEAVVDLTLRVGQITERVEVTEEAPLVETTQAAVSGLVDNVRIRALPLNGRSFEQLALLEPAVTATRAVRKSVNVGSGTLMSVAGSRNTDNTFLLDGTDMNDVGNTTPGSAAGAMLGVEAIREFRVFTHNYGAQYGRAAGGVISAVTRSGTNELHGSVFAYHRNSALDARNFFDRSEVPPFKRNQFGFFVGGPIKKDRTFFAFTYEGLRERLGSTQISTVPNQDARRGILPGLGNVGVAPGVQPYLDLYPLPNGRDFGNGTAEFIFTNSLPTNEDYFMGRIDHTFSDSHRLFGRYVNDDSDTVQASSLNIFSALRRATSQYFTVEENWIITSQALNSFRAAFNRTTPRVSNVQLRSINDKQLEFIPGSGGLGSFRFGLTGGGSVQEAGPIADPGPNTLAGQFFIQNLFQLNDDFIYRKGNHSLKFGVATSRYQLNISQEGFINRRGSFNIASLPDFLRGRAQTFSVDAPGSDRYVGWRQTLLGFYFQDDFTARRNLTLNLGLRYEFLTDPNEVNGKNYNLTNPSDPEVTLGKKLTHTAKKAIAPRIGFAWDPFSDQKTAIRGGVGLYYTQLIGRAYAYFPARGRPLQQTLSITNPVFPHPLDDLTGARITPGPGVSLQQSRTPTLVHLGWNIQRQLGNEFVFDIGYVGTIGYHLRRNLQWNIQVHEIVDGQKFFPRSRAQAVLKNPNFGSIQNLVTDAVSDYHALTVGLRKRSRQWFLQGSYTFSKFTDDASGAITADAINNQSSPQDPDDRSRDHGFSAFDIPHNFVLNATYDFPFYSSSSPGLAAKLFGDWSIRTITSLASGPPFTVQVAFDNSRSVFGQADRPNLVPGASNNPVLGGPDRYYDPGAFSLARAGFYGNLGRNTLRAPGIATVDFALSKKIKINETWNVQFLSEFFNLFNRVNFGLPAVNVFDSRGVVGNAGRIINTTTTSRQIQFSLKLQF